MYTVGVIYRNVFSSCLFYVEHNGNLLFLLQIRLAKSVAYMFPRFPVGNVDSKWVSRDEEVVSENDVILSSHGCVETTDDCHKHGVFLVQ